MVPKGWVLSCVGNACNIKNNLRLPISSDERSSMSGEYPYYGPTGILGYINEYRIDEEFALIGEDGDHFLKYKDKEMTLLIAGKANVNNHAHIITNSALCLASWFQSYFVHKDITSHLTRQGAKRYKLTKAGLEKLSILLPPIPEQRKIAQILSTWDKAITTTERLLTNRQQQKKALMQRLLTGKQRFAGFEGEWITVTIDDAIVVGRGFAFKSESYVESGLKIVRVTNISDSGDIDLKTNCVFVSVESVETYKNYYLQDGDVLLVMVGATAGKLGFVTPQNLPSLLNQNMWYLRTKNESNLLQSFLKYIIRGTVSKYLDSQQGSARGFFTQSTFNKLELRIPKDIDEQQKIASVLSAADAEISTIQNQLDNLKQQKKALMQQLLTGKRRVKVDSPALATQ